MPTHLIRMLMPYHPDEHSVGPCLADHARAHAPRLLDPWGKDALDLPVEEYLLLPLASHRKLLQASTVGTTAVPDAVSSIFVSPLHSEDTVLLRRLGQTQIAFGKHIQRSTFRELARINTGNIVESLPKPTTPPRADAKEETPVTWKETLPGAVPTAAAFHASPLHGATRGYTRLEATDGVSSDGVHGSNGTPCHRPAVRFCANSREGDLVGAAQRRPPPQRLPPPSRSLPAAGGASGGLVAQRRNQLMAGRGMASGVKDSGEGNVHPPNDTPLLDDPALQS